MRADLRTSGSCSGEPLRERDFTVEMTEPSHISLHSEIHSECEVCEIDTKSPRADRQRYTDISSRPATGSRIRNRKLAVSLYTIDAF